MKMLLMIPIDVIDSVPAIKEYLENGTQLTNKGKKWKAALEESVARNKAVIDACTDAVVVIDTKATIVYFNPGNWETSSEFSD